MYAYYMKFQRIKAFQASAFHLVFFIIGTSIFLPFTIFFKSPILSITDLVP